MTDASPAQIRKAAARWLAADMAQRPLVHSEDRVRACACHLMSLGVASAAADETAMAAWAAIDGLPRGCRFDLDASTPWLVWLVDETEGLRVPVCAAEILSLVGLRTAAA